MYHIGDLKRFIRCPRYYFLTCDEKINNTQYLRSDESIIDLLCKHLHIDNCYKGSMGENNECFFNNADSYQWFVNTRFELENLRIKIPLMHKDKDAYDIYFFYRGIALKDLDFYYYRCNLEILRKLGIEIDDIYIIYINKDYVYHESLDSEELFLITDHYKGKRLIDLFDEEIADYKEIIKRIEGTNIDSYVLKKNKSCHLHNSQCPFYYECFKEEKDLPDDSILTLVSSQYKEKMYNEGIKYLKDANVDELEGNKIQYAQVLASRNGGQFVDKYNLKKFLSKLDSRPICFIDFEWDTYIIPKYEGMKALDVLPFEYVMFILDENDELKSYSFLGNGDCRREFVEALLNNMPKSGPIVAYNALGAEVMRVKELANYFPEYEKELLDIADRFVDLAFPFINGLVYDVRMRGNLTLKKLVDIISGISYKDLEISDGIDAVLRWRDIDLGNEDINEEETINSLIEYCGLDAYGLYLVYKWLLELI